MGFFEIIIILAVALVVLGPERMPEVIRMAVKIIREVRTAANEAMREITEAIEQETPPAPPSPAQHHSEPPQPLLEHPTAPSQMQPAPPPDKEQV